MPLSTSLQLSVYERSSGVLSQRNFRNSSTLSAFSGGASLAATRFDFAYRALAGLGTLADGSGGTAHASVSVIIAPEVASAESLELWPPGGLAPLNVWIGFPGFSGVPISIDVEGDGSDDFTGVATTDGFHAAYTRAGTYVPTVRITMPDGSPLVRRGLVEVYDFAALDARLQGVWSGFKDALRNKVGTAVFLGKVAKANLKAAIKRTIKNDVLPCFRDVC